MCYSSFIHALVFIHKLVKPARVCQCLSGGAIMKLTNTVTNITKNNKGFSLLEVLVGVSIIGIISAIAVPTFTDYREGAALTAADTSLKNVAKSYNLCIAQKGSLANCNTKAFLNINCEDCTVAADTDSVCAHIETAVGGQTFRACWASDKDNIVYGGSFKICYCKQGATGTGAGRCTNAGSVDVAKSPVKKCDAPTDCGTAGDHTCKAGTANGGKCATGTCAAN